MSKPTVLLIDDDEPKLRELERALLDALRPVEFQVRSWIPNDAQGDAKAAFEKEIADRPVLVATDYDLTKKVKGLFGLSIVAWCQQKAIPVGDFSRGTPAALPTEPELFELRVPADTAEGARYLARAARGFATLRERLKQEDLRAPGLSPAALLARLLERPEQEDQLSLYFSWPVGATAPLRQLLVHGPRLRDEPSRIALISYVLGHVLLNGILRYPGPILAGHVACGYLGTAPSSMSRLRGLFEAARYNGPFDDGSFYWREAMDHTIAELAELAGGVQVEGGLGDFNRAVAERALGGEPLGRHQCERCDGRKGGFWCPLTERAVCERDDCSVAGSSWIPDGAVVSRIERTFFDEWSPILGL